MTHKKTWATLLVRAIAERMFASLRRVLVLAALGAVGGMCSGLARRRKALSFAQRRFELEARRETFDDAEPAQRDDAAPAAPWIPPLKRALNHGGTRRNKRDRAEAKRKQVQLATVDPANGRPSVRTVVFRGFLPDDVLAHGDADADADGGADADADGAESCLLCFVTDSRVSKARHVRDARDGDGGAFVELCWWLDEASVQFRIAGRAVLADGRSADPRLRAARARVWEKMSDATRRTFAWPEPGAPVAAAAARARAGRAAAERPVELADAHFAVLIVAPERVDELHLGGRQKRLVYAIADDARRGGDEDGPLAGLPSGGAAWRVERVNP